MRASSTRYAAVAVSASALLLAGVVLAADEPGSKADSAPAADTIAAPDTAAPDALTSAGAQAAEASPASPAAAAPSTPSDPPQQASAKSRKVGKESKPAETSASASTSPPPTTAQVQPDERVCHLEQAPGSRVRKTVCITAAQQSAIAKDGQDYLKRAYEDSLHPTPNAGAFNQAR